MTRPRPTLAALLAGVALVAALAIGASQDPTHPPATGRHAGFVIVEADLHVHTRFSDGFLSPLDVVLHAHRQGLGAIALTEHNVVFPAKMARAWSRWIGGPEVLIGEEITTRDYHLLAFGIERAVDARLPLREAIGRVHEQGGVVIAAHPARRFWPGLRPGLDLLDGVEVVHPAASRRTSGSGWSSEDFVTFWEEVRAVRPEATAIGTSDYHAGPVLGLSTTWLFARSPRAEDLVEALRAGRTVVEDPEGRRFGHPELLRSLEGQALPEKPSRDVSWKGRGPLDRFARALAGVALLVLVLARRSA